MVRMVGSRRNLNDFLFSRPCTTLASGRTDHALYRFLHHHQAASESLSTVGNHESVNKVLVESNGRLNDCAACHHLPDLHLMFAVKEKDSEASSIMVSRRM
ncbi:uncharacterized protein LOC124708224 [Lolium rigidum]|uniref:uncharacterized protein LOC124708224 n=1 Tax=Lolium rigidum TaxID=89674 RepID=UPI001F5D7770|nr:uncharacterized protein LOC124708224 [Lolium rigidum]